MSSGNSGTPAASNSSTSPGSIYFARPCNSANSPVLIFSSLNAFLKDSNFSLISLVGLTLIPSSLCPVIISLLDNDAGTAPFPLSTGGGVISSEMGASTSFFVGPNSFSIVLSAFSFSSSSTGSPNICLMSFIIVTISSPNPSLYFPIASPFPLLIMICLVSLSFLAVYPSPIIIVSWMSNADSSLLSVPTFFSDPFCFATGSFFKVYVVTFLANLGPNFFLVNSVLSCSSIVYTVLVFS